MNNLTLIFIFSFICFAFGGETEQIPPNSDCLLKELQESTLFNYQNGLFDYFQVYVAPALSMKMTDFLDKMQFVDDCFFVLFWYSFGYHKRFLTQSIGDKFFKELSEQTVLGKIVFDSMIVNYLTYLREYLPKEFAQAKGDADREALISKLQAFHNEKIYQISAKLGNLKGFDGMHERYLFYQNAINHDIYSLLESKFASFFKSYRKGDKKSIRNHEEQIHFLVRFLSKDEEKKFGLPWIANHPNPIVVLFYFLYQIFQPTSQNSIFNFFAKNFQNKLWNINKVIEFIQHRILRGNTYSISNGVVKFYPEFKSPFDPSILGDDELKDIVSKIIPKVLQMKTLKFH
jgi:hypothetical protein